jgi:hypothetical protein
MDTDNLSNEAYDGIIREAEKFNHDLTLHFGALAADCKDEEEYLKKAQELIIEIKNLEEEEYIDLFFGNLPNLKELNKTLEQIDLNIEKVKQIPKEKRHYEF